MSSYSASAGPGEDLPPELEERISYLEDPKNQGEGFTGRDWLVLALSGVIGPLLLLLWGWPS